MTLIADPFDELTGTVQDIAEMQHLESLEGVVNACFHRCHQLARLALAAGSRAERIALVEFADKLNLALDTERPPRFISVIEAARLLGVSEQTISRRIKSGTLPASKLAGTTGGGRETILIDQADVLRLLEPYAGPEANQ